MPSLSVEEVDFASPAGSKLAIENSVVYPPAVFLEGRLIGQGKIEADDMIATIREANGVLAH
jgi:hypothetical protein